MLLTGMAKPVVRADILGKLLLIQETLDVMPDSAGIAAFLRRALCEIPGVLDMHLYMEGEVFPPSKELDEVCVKHEEARYTSNACADFMVGTTNVALVPIRTVRHIYGMLIPSLADKEAFLPYLAFVQNIANVVATTLETREYIRQLDDARTCLETQVAERTRTLKESQESLRESEERWEFALEGAGDGVWDWDVQTNQVIFSKRWKEMIGYAEDEIEHSFEAWKQQLHPDDLEPALAALQDYLDGKSKVYQVEFRMRCKDGSWKWILTRGKVVACDANGQFLRVIGTHADIGDRKQAEEELRRNEEVLRLFVEHSPAAIAMCDREMKYIAASRRFNMDYGLGEQNLVGRSHYDVFPEIPDRWKEIHRRCLAGSIEKCDEDQFPRADGRIDWVRWEIRPWSQSEGVIGGIIMFSEVITERKRVEEELRHYKDHLEEEVQQRTTDLMLARNAAEAANLAKSAFLSGMNHELRTPLNAILGFSNLLRKDPLLSPEQRDNLDIINRSGAHLLNLINDVLEMAKIESGRVRVESAPFDLGGLMRDVTDMMQLRAREKGLRLLIDQSSAFPRYIMGDEIRLRQVLINLVGNAVKYTRQGGVTVRFGMKPNALPLHLLIEIEDSGIGIRQEDQLRIFEPFTQLGQTAEQQGTGLGLSITRQFVQLMGGVITVASTPGKGSIFRVELPMVKVAASDVTRAESAGMGEVVGLAPGQPECRILIVEDQLENQLLLAKLMGRVGFQVKVAENGEQALTLFQSWRPQLIWMDRHMPVMDGLEATRRIRALPGGCAVKIVAVTASVFMEQRAEMLVAGMDDFLRKPYRFNEIYECLSKQLGVQYIYADMPVAEEVSDGALTAERLAVLPADLRRELRDALGSLENERISAVIGQIASHDAALHKALSRLTANFDYPAILKALQTN